MQRLRVLEMERSLLCGLGDSSQNGKVGGEGEVQDRGRIVQSCELWEESGFFLMQLVF